MIGVRIFQEGDLGLDQLAAVARNRPGLLKVLGNEGVRQFKQNFRTLGQRPNKLQAPSTGFWNMAAASTSYAVDPAAMDVTISVSHRGVRLQYEGGTVRQKPGGPVLTIPVHPDAHGKTTDEVGPLKLVVGRRNAGLARPGPPGSKVDEWMFVFKRAVTIRPHPEVIPTARVLGDALTARAWRWLGRNSNN